MQYAHLRIQRQRLQRCRIDERFLSRFVLVYRRVGQTNGTHHYTGHIHMLCPAWKRLWLYEGYLNLALEAVTAAPFVPFCVCEKGNERKIKRRDTGNANLLHNVYYLHFKQNARSIARD